MIREFDPQNLENGVRHALISDGSVIRGLVDPGQAERISALVPETGKQRVYLSPRMLHAPELEIPVIIQKRAAIRMTVSRELGRSATSWGTYVMRPDMLRNGKTKPHLDGRGAIISGSLNLALGSTGETVFFAQRLTSSGAPYSIIESTWEQNDVAYEDMEQCQLGVGDMVIVTRGVIHGSFAPEDRKSITYRTRGLVAGDFR